MTTSPAMAPDPGAPGTEASLSREFTRLVALPFTTSRAELLRNCLVRTCPAALQGRGAPTGGGSPRVRALADRASGGAGAAQRVRRGIPVTRLGCAGFGGGRFSHATGAWPPWLECSRRGAYVGGVAATCAARRRDG